MPNSPDPLTAEEEAAVRSWNADGPPGFGRGVAALEIVPRLLATLDAARSDLDGAKRLNTDLLATLPIEDTSKPVPTTGPKRSFIGYAQPAAVPSQPEPLDAERLARAMVAVMTHPDQPVYDGFEWYGAANDLARDVAAVYARLSETPR